MDQCIYHCEAVRRGEFPQDQHSYKMVDGELDKLKKALGHPIAPVTRSFNF
jgi:hypothetical protein